jgi:D-serine deaminase-like pyridoxal phosphate-dependent protein
MGERGMTAPDEHPTPPTREGPAEPPAGPAGSRREREQRRSERRREGRPPTPPEAATTGSNGAEAEPDEAPALPSFETPTPPPSPTPREAYQRYERAFEDVPPPFAFLDLDAVWANAADMLRRAGGKPIRVASKSVRCRLMLTRILDLDPGFQGLLTYTLPETIWLWEQGFRDLVLAYPTTDRGALIRLARITAESPDDSPVVTVDCSEHLDLIESAAGSFVAPIRVAIDIDMSWWPLRGLVKIGAKRSPIHRASQAVRLAHDIERRRHVKLVGLMAYEAQIAGVGNNTRGKPLRNAAIRAMQAGSARDVAARRAEIVAAVQEVTEVDFVNGGGTGSLELTAAEGAVTEIGAGSGFYAPVLYDHYRAFHPHPAAIFVLPVTRRPARGVATLLGGGYLASGVGARDRMPVPYLPGGLKLDPYEGAGEVQTPLLGPGADRLAVGDRVYLRHVKAGELCERFQRLHLLAGDTIVEQVPTYRGEGKAFL